MYNPIQSRPYEHLIETFREVLAEISPDFFIRKSMAGDVLLLDIRKEQMDTFDNTDADRVIRTHAWIAQLTPMHYTIFYKETMLLIANVMPLMSGTAEISFLVDNAFVNAEKDVKKMLIVGFRKALYELPFRRLEAKVKDEFEIGRTFVERLGFEQEGVLRKYGPENDYIMYSLIKS